jgi:hypothetical protein
MEETTRSGMSHLDYYLTITPETPWHEVLKELGGHVDGPQSAALLRGVRGAEHPGRPEHPRLAVVHR